MPAYAKGISLMGTIQLRMGNIHEAEKHFAKAVSLEPRNSDFLFNQANALRESGRLLKRGRNITPRWNIVPTIRRFTLILVIYSC